MRLFAAALAAVLAGNPAPATSTTPLKIGVTLHPYYSWTANIVGDAPGVEVRSLLPGEIDAGDYQPRPEDVKKLADLDVLVVNGIGHDDFVNAMIKAAGNKRLKVIKVNEGTPQIRALRGDAPNAHTFISFTNAIQQTYFIARKLGEMRPALAATFDANAAAYAKRLRVMKADAAKSLAEAKVTRVVTVHDGYGYLLQEFGLEIAGVVQPAHGLTPSAAELKGMIDLLKKDRIKVVFGEESFPKPMLDLLEKDGGAKAYVITHIASGDYTAEKFEKEMQKNVDSMVKALVEEPGG